MGCASTKLDGDAADPSGVNVEPKVMYTRQELDAKLEEHVKRVQELEAICKVLKERM